MILVHRLRGEPLYVNADLIETVEAKPDTVLTLIDGRQVLVDEDPSTIVERFAHFRASLLAAAEVLRGTDAAPGAPPSASSSPPLTVVSDPEA